jgi:hypothetical protein
MDEIWQRHKSFILQVLAGGVVFLVALLVMGSMYGDANDPEKAALANAERKKNLEAKLAEGHAPAMRSIEEQRSKADLAEKQKWDLARRVASIAGRDAKATEADRTMAYVKENIDWTLANIQGEDKGFAARFVAIPQACLSGLRDAARSALVGRAAQLGKEIDESLGLSQGFPDEEIPEALHGLAIVTDLVGRCLARPGIEKVQTIRIVAHSRFPDENSVTLMSGIGVHVEIVGDPADVTEVIRSFNTVERKNQRMMVLESIEYMSPISTDEDTVKAAINVVGLRFRSETKSEGN